MRIKVTIGIDYSTLYFHSVILLKYSLIIILYSMQFKLCFFYTGKKKKRPQKNICATLQQKQEAHIFYVDKTTFLML